MSFNATTTYAVTATGTSSRGILFRQAGMPLWLDQTSDASYSVNILLDDNSANNLQIPRGAITAAFTGPTNLSSNFQVIGGSVSPTYGPILAFDASTGPQQWVYVPGGWAIAISVCNTLLGVADILSANIDEWTKPGEYVSNAYELTMNYIGGGSTTSCYAAVTTYAAARWIRVASISSPGALSSNARPVTMTIVVGPSFTVGISGVKPVYTVGAAKRGMLPISTASSYAFSPLPFKNTRVTAAAALFTNVSKVLNKEGTVQAARLNPETDNPWNFSAVTYDGIHPAEKYFYGLEKGFYTYSAPSTDLAEFWDYASIGVESVYGRYYPIHRLDNNALVNTFTFVDPDGDTSLAINVDWHVEFRNTSTLWPIGVSAVTLESLHSSQLALMEAGFFFDNVDHKWILGKIVKAANFVRPLVSMHPIGAAAYKVMDRMLPRKQKNTVKPTTPQFVKAAPRPKRGKRNKKGKAAPAPNPPAPRKKMQSGLQMYLNSRK